MLVKVFKKFLEGDVYMAVKNNYDDGVLVKGTAGADSIYSSGDSVTISGGKGNDSIENRAGENTSINAGAGNDSIYNSASDSVTIDTGTGNDTVTNWAGENTSINAGEGNDSIYNSASDSVTIDTGTGNDTVTNWAGYNLLVKYSGGNDYIEGLDETSTLQIAKGTLNTVINTNGTDLFLTVGKNVITLAGAAQLEKINVVDSKGKAVKSSIVLKGTAKADSIENSGSNVSINAGKGNDYIYNRGNSVTISAGAGNDSIDNLGDNVLINYSGGKDSIWGFNETSTLKIASGTMNSVITTDGTDLFLTVGKNVITLAGAAGVDKLNIIDSKGKALNFTINPTFKFTEDNDSVRSELNNYTLNALGGNDSIWNGGSQVTISAGAGNDSISNNGENVLINYSGGNDYINGLNETSTLKIASGTMSSVVNSNGNDLFLTIGENIVTLAGAAALDKVNIVNAKGKAVKYSVKPNFNFTKGNDSLTNYLSSVKLDALAGNDSIQNYGAKVTIAGGAGADSIENYANATIDGGSGDDSINNDAAQVSIAGGAGNDSIWNVGSQVTISAGAGNDSIDNWGENVLINYSGGNDYINGLNETSTLKIASGTMSSVINSDGTNYILTVGKNKITLSGAVNVVDSKGKAVKFTVKTKIVGTDGNDSLSNYADKATIDGGKGRNDIYNSAQKVLFNYSGGKDYIYGFDETSTLKIASGTMSSVVKSDGNNYFLDVGDNSITLEGAAYLSKVNIVNSKGKAVKFTVKEINTVNNYDDKAKLSGTADRDLFGNSGAKVSINAGDGSDTISNYGDSATLIGGKGDDSIGNGYYEKVSINAGDGSDTIDNRGDYATLIGGKGDDYIYNSSENVTILYAKGDGNDTITGYASDVKIKLTDISKVTASFANADAYDPDVVFKVGDGSITFADATNYSKEITFVDKKDKAIANFSCTSDGIAVGKSITLKPSAWGTFYADDFTKVDASKVTSYIAIYGSENNDTLIGSAGDDTLQGGKGNDSLWGGDGADTFIYESGDGKDTIAGFANDDLLEITGDFTGTYNKSKKEAYFQVGDTAKAITLKNIGTTATFNVNGDTYHISGKKLVK